MTRLIIAEKPKMGLEIAEALAKPHKKGQGYIETGDGIVTWCVGHIMRSYLPKEYNPEWEKWSLSYLPMLIDDWQIKVESTKSAQFKIIKELLSKCTEVVNAGDPGREGQLIVDEVLVFLKNKKPVKRILLNSLDKASVTTAFKNLRDNKEFLPTYEAAVCRGYADWLMGMNATRAYTLLAQKTGYKGVLSVGRVQSPTLAIVVRRDIEIENFVPHDYYTIIGTFEHNSIPFNAYWKPQDNITPTTWLDPDGRLINKIEANNIASKVIGKNGIIKDYEEKDGKEFAPLPFNLSKLQIYANAKWGMTAKEVLDICQELYEKHKLQSYPRTEYQHLPENLFTEASIITAHIGRSHPHLANAVQGVDVNLKSSAWNDKKIGDHYGLIPTQVEANLSQLTDKEKKIYQAVCERYLAQFYPPCEYRTAVVKVECEKEIFQANGKVILVQGWKKVFGNEEEEDKKNNDEVEQIFPEMKQGQNVLCKDSKLSEKKTTPPSYYTEGTLLGAMTNVHTLVNDPIQKQKLKDKKGIGTEATRTGIFETLFKNNLLVRNGKKIISSSAGRELIKVLPEKVINPALTAVWEDALDKIEEGKMTPQMFREKQNEWVIKLVEEAKNAQIGAITQAPVAAKTTSKVKVVAGNSGGAKKTTTAPKAAKPKGACPVCKTGQLVEKVAKASGKKFLGCNAWPNCNHVEWPKK